MDSKQKQEAKFKLGICINKIIAKNKTKNNPNLVTSLRKLAAACDVEYSIIQKITSGKKDPQHTTIVAIIEGFTNYLLLISFLFMITSPMLK
ncbi:hypothetical protein IQ13_3413 [Lacibacter cauensis]|uniref:Helix-turn-helix protein n=1 Tax=Lacibacter cauensis TaxID=510947 RepID=A0A562SCD0_9BACT|nr:hypothetical protein [Lacibacter cauensis]TWI79021.1 hypothetical protein IQ13_3413 [Lacibacter cauensis]